MKSLVLLLAVCFFVGASSACFCESIKWATCDGTPCECFLLVGEGERQALNCSTLIPKCFLMKAEMFRAGKTRRKPTETALVDNDGIYDPECESSGLFKARQCNGTEVCWCVNSAGVRRSDKGDKNLECEELVETHWIRVELKHKETASPVEASQLKIAIANAIQERYKVDKSLVEKVEYDGDARLIIVDVKKPIGDRKEDLSRMAYYMEKDVKDLPLFKDTEKFEPSVAGQRLKLENILVYYVDEKAPTITMQRLTGGVIAVIVVVILVVAAGLLVLFLIRRRESGKNKKAQAREMEEVQQSLG